MHQKELTRLADSDARVNMKYKITGLRVFTIPFRLPHLKSQAI